MADLTPLRVAGVVIRAVITESGPEWSVYVHGNYISSHWTRDEASSAAYAVAYAADKETIEPVNAADVLAIDRPPAGTWAFVRDKYRRRQLAALLAHGNEHGVTIHADGTLRPAVPDGVVVIDGRRWRVLQLIDTSGGDVLYRLIPATDKEERA